MQIQNYIFQTQNAIFQTLKAQNFNIEIVMNRGIDVIYPQIMISSTKKRNLQNGQIKLETEIKIITQDLSSISAANILQKIEETITIESLQNFMNYYTVNAMGFENSSVFANDDGFFCGSIVISVILD